MIKKIYATLLISIVLVSCNSPKTKIQGIWDQYYKGEVFYFEGTTKFRSDNTFLTRGWISTIDDTYTCKIILSGNYSISENGEILTKTYSDFRTSKCNSDYVENTILEGWSKLDSKSYNHKIERLGPEVMKTLDLETNTETTYIRWYGEDKNFD